MILNFSFDPSVSSAPIGFTAELNSVASFFDSLFSDPVTINIAVGYGEVNNQPLSAGALGSSLSKLSSYSYSQIVSALAADAKSATDFSSVSSLPTTEPTGGHYWVTTAEAKSLGLLGGAGNDGSIGFSSSNAFDYDLSNGISAGQWDFFGVVAHEVSEILGRQLLVGGTIGSILNSYEPMDLLHFSSPGVRIFSGTQAGYFSPDNGVTNLNSFNTNPGGDFGDWAASAGNNSANAFDFPGVINAFSAADIEVMDALGWDLTSDTTSPTLSGTSPTDNSSNVAVGSNLVLTFNENVKAGSGNVIVHKASDDSTVASIAITDSSQVSISGSTVTINPSGGLAFGTHYYVTMNAGVIQDIAGNAYAGISSSTGFDFTTANFAIIESTGSTTLGTSANHVYLLDGSGSGPTVKYAGADITLGQFGGWTPLGAEKVASGGYEVAWKMMGADQFSFWTTDSNGNYIANLGGVVSGADPTLQSAETLFQQDLNGDGHIGVGVATTPIESNGATTLAQAANHFYLLDSSGSGPTVKYAGDDVTAGQFGGWTPLGAEKVASGGYEIAWKMMGADQFSFWTTDSNGNYIANLGGVVSGSDPTLQSAETLFQQDLNGDGHIGVGVATTPIESNGATTLAQAANHFYLLDSSGSGPTVKYAGDDVTAGQFGGWTPLGAEKVASGGYEIAWKMMGADQFSFWTTDSNGNYIANLGGVVSGSDPTLQSAETLFQQDLNGDGHIGLSGAQMAVAQSLDAASAINLQNDVHHDWII